MPDEPGQADAVAGQRALLSRLRAVVEAKDAENAVLRAELDAERELRRRAERQDPDRGRRKDRKRGGQPGHPGKGLGRDQDPGERKEMPPPA